MWEREIEFSKLLDQCESNPSNSCLKKIAYFAIEEEKLWYKHVVQKIEKRIRKCDPSTKMNYLHAMSAICKVAKKELGTQNKYRQRFKQQNKQIFGALSMVPLENHYKIKRTLEKWKNNEVFDHDFVELALKNLNQRPSQDGRGESSKSDLNFNCSNSNNQFNSQINSNQNQIQNIENNNSNFQLENIEQNIVSNYEQENSTDLNIEIAEKQQKLKQMSDSQEKYSLNDVDNNTQQNCLVQNQIQLIQDLNSNFQKYGSTHEQYNNQKLSINLNQSNFEKQAQNNTLQLNSDFQILNQQIQKTNSNQMYAQQSSQEILLQNQLLCNQFQVSNQGNNNQNYLQNGFSNLNPVQSGFQTAVISQEYQNQQNQHFQMQLQSLQQLQNSQHQTQNFQTKFSNLNLNQQTLISQQKNLNNLNDSYHIVSTNNSLNQPNQLQITTNQENFQQYLSQLQQQQQYQIPKQNNIQQIQLNNFNLQNRTGQVQNQNITQGCYSNGYVQNPCMNILNVQKLGNVLNQTQYQHAEHVQNANNRFGQSSNNLKQKEDIQFDKDVGSVQVQDFYNDAKIDGQKKNQEDQSEIFYENQTQMQIKTENDYQTEKQQVLNQFSEMIQQNVQNVVNQENYDDNCCQNNVEHVDNVQQNVMNVENKKQIVHKRKTEIQNDQPIKKQQSSNSSQNHHFKGENILNKNNIDSNINNYDDGYNICYNINENITCNINNSDNNIDCQQNDKNYDGDNSNNITCKIKNSYSINNNVDVFDDKTDDKKVKKRCITELGSPVKQQFQTKFLYQPYLYRIVSAPGESEEQNLQVNIEPLDEFTPDAPPKLELHFDMQQQYYDVVNNKKNNLNSDVRDGSVDQSPQTCCVIKVFNGEDSPRGFLCDEEEIKKTEEKPRKSQYQSESIMPPASEIYPHHFFSNLRNIVVNDRD